MSVSLFLKNIEPTSDTDASALDEVTKMVARVRQEWPVDTLDILKTKNPGLLEMLQRAENQINSLVAITNKPPQVKKEFKKTLGEYEKVGTMCAVYARRHSCTK